MRVMSNNKLYIGAYLYYPHMDGIDKAKILAVRSDNEGRIFVKVGSYLEFEWDNDRECSKGGAWYINFNDAVAERKKRIVEYLSHELRNIEGAVAVFRGHVNKYLLDVLPEEKDESSDK